MQAATTQIPRSAATRSTSAATAWLLRLWGASKRDDDECFLFAASDLADLERRLRSLERGRANRFGPLY